MDFACSSALDSAASLSNVLPNEACVFDLLLSLCFTLLLTVPQAHRWSLRSCVKPPECLSGLTQQEPGCLTSGVGRSGCRAGGDVGCVCVCGWGAGAEGE